MTGLNGKTYKLLGADGKFYQSATKGRFGGHRKDKIYDTLDCKGALDKKRALRQTACLLRRRNNRHRRRLQTLFRMSARKIQGMESKENQPRTNTKKHEIKIEIVLALVAESDK